jgi:hypothetical protein
MRARVSGRLYIGVSERTIARSRARASADQPERHRAFFRSRFEEEQTQIDAGTPLGLSHMRARTVEYKLRRAFVARMRDLGYLAPLAAAT